MHGAKKIMQYTRDINVEYLHSVEFSRYKVIAHMCDSGKIGMREIKISSICLA